MKVSSFKDLVRDEYYHGIFEGNMDCSPRPGTGRPAQHIVDDALEMIDKKLFDEAEKLLAKNFYSFTIVGVTTYLPTAQDVAVYVRSEELALH